MTKSYIIHKKVLCKHLKHITLPIRIHPNRSFFKLMKLKNRALFMLVVATLGWALSFSLYKAMAQSQQNIFLDHSYLGGLPSTWFFTSYSSMLRFFLAALVLIIFQSRIIFSATRSELMQGLGLGLFGGLGTLFQIDSLNFTSASTTAFLTQCYCLIIPLFISIKLRAWPALRILMSSLMVLWGVAILSGMSWDHFILGRGEAEALICSACFAGQILWLERPNFAKNRWIPSCFFMFVGISVLMASISLVNLRDVHDFSLAVSTPQLKVGIIILTLIPTLFSYAIMNIWQPFLPASRAALVYCAEPFFVCIMGLFVPALYAGIFGVHYENEILTKSLFWGGSLIVLANALAVFKSETKKEV